MTSSGILFLAGAIILSVVLKLLNKSVLRNVTAYSYGFFNNAIASILFLPFIFKNPIFPSETLPWVILIIAVILWTVGYITMFIGYKETELSIREPLNQSKLLWGLLLGTLFLGETLTPLKIIGTIFMFAGIASVVWKHDTKLGRLKESGVQWVLLGALLSASTVIVDKFSLNHFSLEFYAFIVYIGPTLIMSFFLPKYKKDIMHVFTEKRWIKVFLAGIISVPAYYFTLKTLQLLDVTVALPLLQFSTIIVVILAILFMKERTHVAQKIIGTVLAVAGAILLKF